MCNIKSVYNIETRIFENEFSNSDRYYFHGTNSIYDIINNGFIDVRSFDYNRANNQSIYSKKHLNRWNNKKMFGDGIYFADCLYKSAKFSKHIVVCELDLKNANVMRCVYDTIPPNNVDCIIGLGKYDRSNKLENSQRPLNKYEYCVYNVNIIKKKFVIFL